MKQLLKLRLTFNYGNIFIKSCSQNRLQVQSILNNMKKEIKAKPKAIESILVGEIYRDKITKTVFICMIKDKYSVYDARGYAYIAENIEKVISEL